MTSREVSCETKASLPQLSGGLLWTYRVIWSALALSALAVLALSLFRDSTEPALTILRLVKGAVVIVVTAILFRRRQRDPVAALLSVAFLTWTITSSFDFADSNALPQFLDRVRFLLFVLALLLFPDGDWQPSWTRKIAGLSGAVFLLGVAEALRIAPTRLFLPLAIACVLTAIVSLVARFRTARTETLRQQLRWVALGLILGVGLILVARAGAALPQSSRLPPMSILWEAMFQLGIVVIALGFLVSLLRYRLYDAETAISRSAAYAALTVSVVAIFGGTEALIENAGQLYLGMGIGNISGAMAAAVAALLLSPLHSRISDWAEQRFQRDLVLLKVKVPELVGDLAVGSSPRNLGNTVLPSINEAIHATRSAFLINRRIVAVSGVDLSVTRRWARDFLAQADVAPEHDSDDALFPIRMRLGNSFPGWLLLGPRPDGSLYGGDDRDALESILPTLRQAFISTLNGESIRASNVRAIHRTRRELNDLRVRVRAIEAASAPDGGEPPARG